LQLYPSTQYLLDNFLGEPTLYSDQTDSGVLEATSNRNPYSEEYRCVALCRNMLEEMGEKILSVYSNHSNERRCALPRFYPDATIVSSRADGGCVLTFFMYDGFYHVRVPGLHHTNCPRNNGSNDLELSPYYQDTLEAAERNKARCHEVFGQDYELRFLAFSQCVFHSPFPALGRKHRNANEAFEALRTGRPEMCLSAAHKPTLWLDELKSSLPRADGSVLAGFVVFK